MNLVFVCSFFSKTLVLFTRDGVRATVNLSDHSNYFNNTESFIYIRDDILCSYLQKKDLKLIWAIWGERELSTKQFRKYNNGVVNPEQLFKVFNFVKKLN
jgi:hypothetical protein